MSTLLGDARVRVRPDTAGFQREAESKIGKAVAGLGAIVKKGLMAGGAVAAAGAAVGLKVAADMETAKIGFTTMLGSAKKADKFLRNLADFAAKTPFDFPGLQTAASSLVSIGVDAEDVIPIMTTLGNVTSGMGTGAEGVKRATVAIQQMIAAQRISGQDLNQLRDAGIPVFDLLSKATGKTTKEIAAMAQKGKLGKDVLDKMMAALKSGKGFERFNGLMEKQSKSLSGLWATLKDTVQMRLAETMKPLIPAIKFAMDKAAPILDDFLGDVSSSLQKGIETVQRIAPHVKDFVESLSSTVSDAVPDIDFSGIAGNIVDAAKEAGQSLIDGIRSGVETGDWRGFGRTLGDAIHNVLGSLASGSADLFKALLKMIRSVPWGDIALEIGKQAPVFILGLATGLLNMDFGAIFSFLGDHLFEVVVGALTIAFMPSKLLAPIVKIISKVPFVGPMAAWLLKAINTLGGKFLGWVKGLLGSFWKGWAAAGPGLFSKIAGFFDDIAVRLFVWGDDLVKWFRNIPSRFTKWIYNLAESGGRLMRSAMGRILQPIKDLVGWLTTRLGRALSAYRTAVSDAFGAVGRVISGLWENTVRPVFGWIVGKWLSVVGAILTGAATAFGWVPGIGPKLKDAAAKFATFKDDVNAELAGIKDRNVTVTAKGEVMARLASGKYKGKQIPMALGGPVPMVPGARRGKDSVPAVLMPGEYVVRADGSNLHAALSHFGAPGYARGGFVDAKRRAVQGNLRPRFEAAVDKRLGPSAVKALYGEGYPGSQAGLIALGRWLQSLGARVSEHPAFGGVNPVHTKGSKHYVGRALDVNYGPGGQNAAEAAFLDRIAPMLRAKGFDVLWRVPGHFDHLHAAYDRGGLASGKGLMPKATLKPERVLSPRQTAAFEEWLSGDRRVSASAAPAPLIGGDLVLQSSGSVRDDLGEALFQFRRIRRGGSPHVRR